MKLILQALGVELVKVPTQHQLGARVLGSKDVRGVYQMIQQGILGGAWGVVDHTVDY